MVKELKDNAGNLIAVVEMSEVSLTTRMIDKDMEFTAIVMKSGHIQAYAMELEEVVKQLYEI